MRILTTITLTALLAAACTQTVTPTAPEEPPCDPEAQDCGPAG